MGDGIILSQQSNSGPDDLVAIDRKLWLTADRDAVVEDGDPAAAFLYATPGKKVPREEAERLGVVAAAPARKKAEPAEDKQAAKGEDKQAQKPESKGRS